jgi:hypothetical protein
MGDGLGLRAQLAPGDADDAVPERGQARVAGPVLFERLAVQRALHERWSKTRPTTPSG